MVADLRLGDCLEMLAGIESESIDACVTDPPYHFGSIVKRFAKTGGGDRKTTGAPGVYVRHATGFMGKTWDGGDVAFQPETWAAVLRVLKPGAHLLAFGSTRGHHRLTCAIEDAGFEIRDTVMWVYGSGFPKSHNLDGDWEGWGTALKPAWEPIIVARKPLIGTVAQNVAAHGTGAINIDGCRVVGVKDVPASPRRAGQNATYGDLSNATGDTGGFDPNVGRWPANLILSVPEDEYELRDNVTPDQLRQLAEWMDANR